MTENQRKRFYFPKWLALARGLDWVMVGGRLEGNVDAQWDVAARFSIPARDLVREIIHHARQLARAECRAVDADDLRHGLNLVASKGRTASASKLSNAELNQFARICDVLQKPFADDISATVPLVDPAEDDRQRAIEYLRKLAGDDVISAIALNAGGTKDWESLNLPMLQRLTLIVNNRNQRQPAVQPF